MLKELVTNSRSKRRFFENEKIELDILREFIAIARLAPSPSNKQPLKYILSNTQELNTEIFSCLSWARHLTNWLGSQIGERPSAYIIILGDNNIQRDIQWDDGIAAQTIMLAATEAGYGGCMLANFNKKKLRKILQLTEQYEILLVLALGKPKEEVVIETVIDGKTEYWRDNNQVHHVPKRSLEELIL